MVELVDTFGLSPNGEIHESSSLSFCTILHRKVAHISECSRLISERVWVQFPPFLLLSAEQ